MSKPQDFKIKFPIALFRDLNRRIAGTRWPSVWSVNDWSFGTPVNALREVLEYFSDGYNWDDKDRELNRYPQYLCDIDGITLHFFHIPGKSKDAMPILMAHGWPDSFLRYAKTFPLLGDHTLIVPSMPGFAFSSLPQKGYVNNSDVADIYHRLMTDILGYCSYVATGGDMGRGVVCYLASRHPEAVKGLFLTDVGFAGSLVAAQDDTLSAEELAYKKAATEWMKMDGAYIGIQSTRPLSLGYGLSDSPVGMAGWLLEKYHDWSDWDRFSYDDFLDNFVIYWMTNCAQSSVRAYYGNSFTLPPIAKVTVPTAIVRFPKDILPVPKSWIDRNYPVIEYREMPYGGHFTAMEAPAPFADALIEFINKINWM